ncbi:hypothetical protein [Microcoleus sp. F4-D5]|uniref:hypothetical protein n=1 Tax=Microcoleus sp. F4-D5 TaxID=2818760 RepID=UPI002FD5F41F
MLLSGSRKGAIDLSIEAVRELRKLTTYLLAPPADNYAGSSEWKRSIVSEQGTRASLQ